jgi:hypothetical protein
VLERLTIALGVILIGLGVGPYLATGGASVTALIPAFFGLPILAAGLLSLKPSRRRLALSISFGLALLGFLGTVPGLLRLPQLLLGGEVARPLAVLVQAAMATLCGAFLLTGVTSWVRGRRSAGNRGD